MLLDVFLSLGLRRWELRIEHGSICATGDEAATTVVDGSMTGSHASDRPDAVAHLESTSVPRSYL